MGGITVGAVQGRADREAFLRLPHRLHAADPCWVAPLDRDIRAFLRADRHPFAASGSMEHLLARSGDRVVGRITAIVNHAHNRHHGDRAGFFGFFECEDDPDVARALIEAVAGRLRGAGLDVLRGPVSPSTNYECGVLVEGEPGPPVFMMPHNPPHYPGLLEAAGLRKAVDLLAYRHDESNTDVARWNRISDRIRARTGAEFRPIELRRFAREVELITEIYHDAWADNWGFVPMNRREVTSMAAQLRPVIVPWLAGFVTVGGREAGFYLGLPDYNRVLIRLRGRLFPLGFLRLLRARGRIPFMRLLLMGVRRNQQGRGLEALLLQNLCASALSHGIPESESSWILETNTAMNQELIRAGARPYRRYRIYERSLAPAGE
jgi:hypothetical protein